MFSDIKAIAVAFGLILLICVAGCPKPMPGPNPPTPDATDATPPSPPVVVDASPAPTDDAAAKKYTCTTVCANLTNHKCKGASKTVKGSTCVDVCQNTMDSGFITWDLKCRSTKTTCSAIDACP